MTTQVSAARINVPVLYAAHRLQLVRMAVLLVDDMASAEDAAQDAFVGLHRNQQRIRDPQAALGYLRTAVVNTARSMLRRRHTERRHLRVVEPEHGDAPDRGLMLAARHREVLDAVRTLPPGQQECAGAAVLVRAV